jgi:serine/threonine-protein kinase
MSVASVADFVEAIDQARVLPPDGVQQVRGDLQARFPDPAALARELVRMGWLTPYQAQMLLEGKGNGLVVGPYVLMTPLGEGGMGTVYKARHQLMHRYVALKLIRRGHLPHAEAVQRFELEMRAAAALSHPNIVVAYDAGQAGDSHFFAMEYVEGTDLGKVLAKHGPFPVPYACDCARQAALALQHAHERGLVHRDIKPANLLLVKGGSQAGGRGLIKVLDMGLARLRYDPANRGSKALTQIGTVMGSPDYIAPEQILDAHAVDTRADIYSLGCTLYHLLTGRPPFPEGGWAEKLRLHKSAEPRPVRELRPEVSPELAAVIARMMAKRPEQRYQTPAETVAALEPFCRTEPARAPAATAGNAPKVAVTPVPPRAAAPAPSPADVGTTELIRAGKPAPALAGPANGQAATPALAATTSPSRRRRWLIGGAAAAGLLLLLLWLFWPSKPPATEPVPEKEITNSLGMKLVRIPEGEFVMGSPDKEEGRGANEGPQRNIHIPGKFYLGVHEVTQGQYQKVMGNNPSHWQNPRGGGPDFPVDNVNWSQAMEFCYRLSELPAEKEAGRQYRLPTAAEWEYACRAGKKTPFSFASASIPDISLASWQANFDWLKPYGSKEVNKNAPKQPMKVGQFPANPWGLYDMHGNVWEWVADWYDANYYKDDVKCPADNPQGPLFGPHRYVRGGGYGSLGSECRSAVRFPVAGTRADVGFRVVCELTKERLFPKSMNFGAPLVVNPDRQYLDRLDPARLPPENKFAELPKALVWVLGEHRVRHAGYPLSCIAVHPEEKFIATGSVGDSTIRFGDIATLRELKTVRVPSGGQLYALKFSPDGKTLASGGNDKLVRLWDVETGKALKVLAEHKNTVFCLAYSRDGKFLASGGQDGVVLIWDVEKGAKVKELKLDGQGARSVEFSPDGKTLLTGGNIGDGTVRLWDLTTGKGTLVLDCNPTIRDRTAYVSAAFSPDGKEIVTGASDRTVRLFQTSDRKEIFKSADQGTPVVSIAYAPDGTTFSSGYANGAVHVWSRAERVVRFPAAGFNAHHTLTYYPKAKRLLYSSADTMQLWDTEARAEIRPTYGHSSVGTSVVFSPDGQYVLSASGGDHTARLWELQINKELRRLTCYHGAATLSPDGRFALCPGGGGEMVTLFDLKDDRAFNFQGEMSSFYTCVAVSPDGRYIAAGGHDKIARVWDVGSGKKVHRIPDHKNVLRAVLFMPRPGQLLTGALLDDTIRLWDLPSGEQVREFYLAGGLRSGLSLSRDGRSLVAGNANGQIALWDLRDPAKAPKALRQGHKGAVLGVSLAANGSRFASSGEDGKVLLWEAGSSQPTLLAQLPWQVPAVAISPDGNYVAFINTHYTGAVYILRLPKKGG